MTTVLAPDQDLALAQLGARICERHVLFASLSHRTLGVGAEIGHLLLEAKGRVAHGRWLSWLVDETPYSEDQAERLMRLARNSAALRNLPPETTVTQALDAIREARRGEKLALELALLPAHERRAVILAAAPDTLSIKDHRRLIAQQQREAQPRERAPIWPFPGRLPEHCRIELGDARRLPLPDNSAHLVVTSPPYNCRLTYRGYEDWLPWDAYWHGLIEPSLREAYRVLGPGGRLCLNMPNVIRQNIPQPGHTGRATQYQSRGRWKWTPPGGASWAVMVIPRVWALLEEIGFLPREHLTWCKGQESGEGLTALTSTSTAWGTFASAWNPVLRAVAEPVFVASKGSHSREPGPSDLDADEFKRLTKNVWFVPAMTPDLDHPAIFPEELPRRLIKLYSYPGDLVVDPFVGSGTTAVAAAQLGRRVYACDISPAYVELARARVAREVVT